MYLQEDKPSNQVSVISQKALWTIYSPNNDSKGIAIYWQMEPLTKSADEINVASNTQAEKLQALK